MRLKTQANTFTIPKAIQHSIICKHLKVNEHKKRRYVAQENQSTYRYMLDESLVTLPRKKMSSPVVRNSQRFRRPSRPARQNPQQPNNKLSKSTQINYVTKDKKSLDLPPIRLTKINILQSPTRKRYQICNIPPIRNQTHHKRHKTQIPMSPLLLIRSQRKDSLPRICFNKVQGAPNGNLLQFSRQKPTQQHFSKLENVRLAQRLLLMQPSKELRITEHKKFYQTHKTYRQHISQSTIIKRKNLFQQKVKEKKHNRIKSEWVN